MNKSNVIEAKSALDALNRVHGLLDEVNEIIAEYDSEYVKLSCRELRLIFDQGRRNKQLQTGTMNIDRNFDSLKSIDRDAMNEMHRINRMVLMMHRASLEDTKAKLNKLIDSL